MRVRVATFNVRHCRGLDGVVDVERTASVIRRTRADLLALQELDRRLPRSAQIDQVRALSELTGMPIHFSPTLRRSGGEYGLALAATDAEVSFELLPRLAGQEPRGVIGAAWRGTNVLATHLSKERPARARQTRAVAEMAIRRPRPLLVLGDFNQSRSALRPLVEAGLVVGGPRMPTMARGIIRRQIDYVLVDPGTTVVRMWTVSTDASDHVPLVAELEFR